MGQFQQNLGVYQIYNNCKIFQVIFCFENLTKNNRDLSYNQLSGTILTQLEKLTNLQNLLE